MLDNSLLKDINQKPTQVQMEALNQLRKLQEEHPFWNNCLFRACKAKELVLEDLQFIFSQYYLYSKNFTRYLSALMAKSNNEVYRSRLYANLWEESGGLEPEKRPDEMFHKFLKEGLSINIDKIEYLDSTRYFVNEYLTFCLDSHPMATSAFLSLGAEGIVARVYSTFMDVMVKANIDNSLLRFFRIRMQGGNERAITLEDMMLSYSDEPDWYNVCVRSMNRALGLQTRFFEHLYEALRQKRVQGIIDNIQARKSLAPKSPELSQLIWSGADDGIPLYSNTNERLNIQFDVTRLPFNTEVLDPRIVKIPPGRNNEKHTHAHETIFYFIAGKGQVLVDDTTLEVTAGDVVFVPRWCVHQSLNKGNTEMVILALADFGLTGKAHIGDYNKTARMKHVEEVIKVITKSHSIVRPIENS